MDPERPTAEALATKDGRILAIGTERELKQYIGAETWITELDEGVLLPGFIDTSGELLSGELLGGEPLDDDGARDLAAAQRVALRAGVTTSMVGAADAADLARLDAANLNGSLELDVVALPVADEATRLIGRRDFARYRGRLHLAGIRFDVEGDEPEEWNRLVRHCAANHVRILASCASASAIDRLLDALEDLPPELRAERSVILHSGDPSADRVARGAALDVSFANTNASEQSVRSLTVDAAFQLDESDEKGTLAPGKRADLVVLSADPTGLLGSELREVEVWQTYKDGRLVYELEGRAPRLIRKWLDDGM
jgi:predicted amidohydrolase YtcJ